MILPGGCVAAGPGPTLGAVGAAGGHATGPGAGAADPRGFFLPVASGQWKSKHGEKMRIFHDFPKETIKKWFLYTRETI